LESVERETDQTFVFDRSNGRRVGRAAILDVANEVGNFFAAMEANIDREWPDPAKLGPPVSDQMTRELVEKAKASLREAQRKATLATRAEQTGRVAGSSGGRNNCECRVLADNRMLNNPTLLSVAVHHETK